MAQPLTWRNIAGPTFNNSAGGQAIDAFNLAGTGFLQGAEQLQDTQEVIDKGYTNDALRQTLQTGQVDPNMNRRADSAAVWEALLGKQKAESDNSYTQAQTRNVGLEADQRAFEQTPEQRAIAARKTAQDLAAGEIGMQADLAGINTDNIAAKLNQRRAEIENRDDSEAQQIKSQYRALEGFLVQGRQKAYDEYLQNNPGDMAGANQAATAWDEYDSRAAVEEFRVKNNIMPEAYSISTWGGRDELRDASMAALAQSRLERQEVRDENIDRRLGSELAGNLTNTVVRGGIRTEASDNDLEEEKMTSFTQAISKIENHGINISGLAGIKGTSDEAVTINLGREKFPNSSLLAGAIEPYIGDGGKFDWQGFRSLLQTAGPLTNFDAVNRVRAERGLPRIEGDGGSGSTGGKDVTAGDIFGSAAPAAQSAAIGIAVQLLPSSIRSEAEEFLNKESTAKDKMRNELVKASLTTPIDKANMLAKLLKAYLGPKDINAIDKVMSWPFDPMLTTGAEGQPDNTGTIDRQEYTWI